MAIVGAGVAGLACARTLHGGGLAVTLIDRGRAPGGRLATRRSGAHAFDHGVQYFTARDERFARVVRSWADGGIVARWDARLAERRAGGALHALSDEARWVGVPEMSAVARHLAAGLTLLAGTVVAAIERRPDGWRLRCDGAPAGTRASSRASSHGFGPFDVVLVTAPAPHAAALLAPAPDLAARAAAAVLAPCLAAMVAFAEPLDPGFDGATIAGSPLAWAACDSSKPCRPPGARWVLHGAPAWSAEHVDDPPEAVATALLGAFADVAGHALPGVVHREAHRWRHALVTRPLGEDCLYDASARLGACGDWCLGGRVEAAFLSGIALAGRVLGSAVR